MDTPTQPNVVNGPQDMEKRVAQYVLVRDELKKLDEKQKAERKPLLEIQETLAGIIGKFLDTANLESLKTAAGTAYKSVRHSATLQDPNAFMTYVIENRKWDLLDRRANATAVKAFVKETKMLPPGCNLSAIETLGVRRKGSGGSADADE